MNNALTESITKLLLNHSDTLEPALKQQLRDVLVYSTTDEVAQQKEDAARWQALIKDPVCIEGCMEKADAIAFLTTYTDAKLTA